MGFNTTSGFMDGPSQAWLEGPKTDSDNDSAARDEFAEQEAERIGVDLIAAVMSELPEWMKVGSKHIYELEDLAIVLAKKVAAIRSEYDTLVFESADDDRYEQEAYG